MNIRIEVLIPALLLGALAWSTAISENRQQPVAFNHNKHIDEVGMDCPDCHQFVTRGRKATLPTKGVCMDCHSEVLGESPEEAKLVSILESDRDLDWRRVYVLPKHVYFSHFRHVTIGQIGCPTCHGNMAKLTSPPTKPAVDIIDMDFCIDCHRQRQVSEDCLICHY